MRTRWWIHSQCNQVSVISRFSMHLQGSSILYTLGATVVGEQNSTLQTSKKTYHSSHRLMWMIHLTLNHHKNIPLIIYSVLLSTWQQWRRSSWECSDSCKVWMQCMRKCCPWSWWWRMQGVVWQHLYLLFRANHLNRLFVVAVKCQQGQIKGP